MTTLTLEQRHDPVAVDRGCPVTSEYVETFWLPVIGPTAICLLRWGARRVTNGCVGIEDVDLARSLGLGGRARGVHDVLRRLTSLTLIDNPWDGYYLLPSHLLPIGRDSLLRLPEELQDQHRSLMTAVGERRCVPVAADVAYDVALNGRAS